MCLAEETARAKALRWDPAWLGHRGQTLLFWVPEAMGLYSEMRWAEGGLGPPGACPVVLELLFARLWQVLLPMLPSTQLARHLCSQCQ